MPAKLLIGGERVAWPREPLAALDPATGEDFANVAEASPEQVDAAKRNAGEAVENNGRPRHGFACVDTRDVGAPEMQSAATKGSGTGCEMPVHSPDAITVRHVMVGHA